MASGISPISLCMLISPSPQTNIRIKFTDRTQLEKSFPSTNKIRTVYAFVRSCLREDVKPIKFILCTSTRRLWPLVNVFYLQTSRQSAI